jgi:hypothetical protein
MIEDFKLRFEHALEQFIDKNKQPTYQDFTEKILPAMFEDKPYIRVTYNTDLKDFERYKFYKKKPQRGLWLENVIQPNLAAALWYRVNPVWLKYCESYMKSNKPAYVILSQIKNRNLRFCIARIIEFHSFSLVYQDIEKNKELFDLAQDHEFRNNHNHAWHHEVQEKSLEIDKEQKRQMIMFVPPQTQILTLNNISPIDVELAKKAKSVKNTSFIEKIPTLTHSYLPIVVDKYGKIKIGNDLFFEKHTHGKAIFLYLLLTKLGKQRLIHSTKDDRLADTTLKQLQNIFRLITTSEIDIEYFKSNFSKNISNLNGELEKLLCENMYKIIQRDGATKFEKDFPTSFIEINKEFRDKCFRFI